MNRPPLTPACAEAAGEPKSLKIDPQVHRRLKVEAATRGVSLQILTETALLVGLAGLAHTLRYRDYIGSIEASPVTGRLCGRILIVPEAVIYEGSTIPELEAAFQRAVDGYECRKSGTAA